MASGAQTAFSKQGAWAQDNLYKLDGARLAGGLNTITAPRQPDRHIPTPQPPPHLRMEAEAHPFQDTKQKERAPDLAKPHKPTNRPNHQPKPARPDPAQPPPPQPAGSRLRGSQASKQTNKQTNKQASKQASKQTNKQTHKQTNKQTNTTQHNKTQTSISKTKQTNQPNPKQPRLLSHLITPSHGG